LPLLLEKPGRTRQESPHQWHGQSVVRRVEVEYSDRRVALEALRFVVVHSNQLAQQAALTYAKAQTQEAVRVAEHIRRVEARRFACAADAEAALADYEGHGQGRRGRRPRPWRYHTLRYSLNVARKLWRRFGLVKKQWFTNTIQLRNRCPLRQNTFHLPAAYPRTDLASLILTDPQSFWITGRLSLVYHR